MDIGERGGAQIINLYSMNKTCDQDQQQDDHARYHGSHNRVMLYTIHC